MACESVKRQPIPLLRLSSRDRDRWWPFTEPTGEQATSTGRRVSGCRSRKQPAGRLRGVFRAGPVQFIPGPVQMKTFPPIFQFLHVLYVVTSAVRPTEKVEIKPASRLSGRKRVNKVEILHSKCFLLRAFFGESSAQKMMKTKEDAKGHIATSDTFAEVT